jgi:hypothetical protein
VTLDWQNLREPAIWIFGVILPAFAGIMFILCLAFEYMARTGIESLRRLLERKAELREERRQSLLPEVHSGVRHQLDGADAKTLGEAVKNVMAGAPQANKAVPAPVATRTVSPPPPKP